MTARKRAAPKAAPEAVQVAARTLQVKPAEFQPFGEGGDEGGRVFYCASHDPLGAMLCDHYWLPMQRQLKPMDIIVCCGMGPEETLALSAVLVGEKVYDEDRAVTGLGIRNILDMPAGYIEGPKEPGKTVGRMFMALGAALAAGPQRE